MAIGAGYLAIAVVFGAFFYLTMLVVTPVSAGHRAEI